MISINNSTHMHCTSITLVLPLVGVAGLYIITTITITITITLVLPSFGVAGLYPRNSVNISALMVHSTWNLSVGQLLHIVLLRR